MATAEKGFDIPSIDQALDAKLRVPLERIRQTLQTLQGFRGDGLVGGHLKSTNYVEGLEGWRIKPDGDAEFYRVTLRGGIYASFGTIGGAKIGYDYVQSSNFVTGVSGWRLDNTTGSVEIQDLTARGDIKASSLEVGTNPAISGTTMTGQGAIFNQDGTFAAGDADTNITFNGTALALNGEVIGSLNLKGGSASMVEGNSVENINNIQLSMVVTAADIPTGQTTIPVIVTGGWHMSSALAFGIGRKTSPTFAGDVANLFKANPSSPGIYSFSVKTEIGVGTHYFRVGWVTAAGIFDDDFTTIRLDQLNLSIVVHVAKR